MIPQINNDSNSNIYNYRQPSLTYRMGDSTVAGKINNLQSVKQSVEHILSIERYSCPIYDDNYGVELEQYIGKDLAYISATIEQTLSDALTQDDRITNIQVNDIRKSTEQLNACLIDFTVYTIYGTYEEELNVLQ